MSSTKSRIGTISLVAVPATNQDRSIEFYEALGFEKRTDLPFGDKYRWVEVYPPTHRRNCARPASPGHRPDGRRDRDHPHHRRHRRDPRGDAVKRRRRRRRGRADGGSRTADVLVPGPRRQLADDRRGSLRQRSLATGSDHPRRSEPGRRRAPATGLDHPPAIRAGPAALPLIVLEPRRRADPVVRPRRVADRDPRVEDPRGGVVGRPARTRRRRALTRRRHPYGPIPVRGEHPVGLTVARPRLQPEPATGGMHSC